MQQLISLCLLFGLAAGSGSTLMRKEDVLSDNPVAELGTWVVGSASGLGSWVRQRFHADSIPVSIRQLAIGLFGATYAEQVLAKAVRREVMLRSETITLHAYGSDDALQSLPSELSGSVYGVSSLTNADIIGPVADIGANLGTFSVTAYKANPKIQILSLEPMPITYLFLRWNLEANKVPVLTREDFMRGKPGVLPLNVAASADGRTIEIMYDPQKSQNAVTSASGHDSQIPTKSKVTSGRELRKTITSVNVARYFADMSVHKLGFLKISCEGCEHEVVPEITALLKNSKHVGAEIHPCLAGHSCNYPEDTVNQTRTALCELGRCCTSEGTVSAAVCFS